VDAADILEIVNFLREPLVSLSFPRRYYLLPLEGKSSEPHARGVPYNIMVLQVYRRFSIIITVDLVQVLRLHVCEEDATSLEIEKARKNGHHLAVQGSVVPFREKGFDYTGGKVGNLHMSRILKERMIASLLENCNLYLSMTVATCYKSIFRIIPSVLL